MAEPTLSDDLIEQDVLRQSADIGSVLGASLRRAGQVNPESYAKAVGLSKQTGIPVPVVERNLETIETQMRSRDLATLAERAPVLTRQLMDPERAKLLQDDYENLSGIEQAAYQFHQVFQVAKNLPKAFASAVPGTGSGLAGAATAAFELRNDIERRIARRMYGPEADTFLLDEVNTGGRAMRQTAVELKQASEELMPRGRNVVERGIYSGVQSAAQTLAFAPFGVAGLLGGMGATTFGQSFIKGTERDPNDPTRRVLDLYGGLKYAGIDAAIEVGTELLPAKHLFKTMTAGSGFGKAVGKFLLHEAAGEQLATLGQSFNEWATLHPDKPIQTWIDSLPEAAQQTFVASLVGGGVQVGAMKLAQKGIERFAGKQVEAQAELGVHSELEKLASLAKASKVLGRGEAGAEAFLQAVEPMTDGSVYINAQTFAEVTGGLGIDPMQAALTSRAVSEQFESALAEGRDMEIPIAEFAAMQQQSFAQSLLDHVKLTADGQTKAELNSAVTDPEGLKAEVEKAVSEGEKPNATEEFKASSARVMESELEKFTELRRFNEGKSRDYAAGIVVPMYEQLARRLGITPEEAQRRNPFYLSREGKGDLTQREDQGLKQRQSALEQLAECIG